MHCNNNPVNYVDPSGYTTRYGFGDFRVAQSIFNQEIDLGEVLVNIVAPAVDKYIAQPIQKGLENHGTVRGAVESTAKAVAGTASLFTPVGEVSELATIAYVKLTTK